MTGNGETWVAGQSYYDQQQQQQQQQHRIPYPPQAAAAQASQQFRYGTFGEGNTSFPQPVHPHYMPRMPRQHYVPVCQVITEGQPLCSPYMMREERLPFCGIGVGWFLFLIGFISIISWFIGAVIFLCFKHDYREKVGLAACTIAAFVTLLVGGSRFM